MQEAILVLKSADRPGILARITPCLFDNGCDVREASVHGDPESGNFFVRMHISSAHLTIGELRAVFTPVARDLALDWTIHDASAPLKVLIAVSKFGHCLIDLVHKRQAGTLPIDICGVVSNHPDLENVVENAGIAFHYLPITKATKLEQEAQMLDVMTRSGAEILILARYMQILSDDFARGLAGRCINIHHSFLPSFKGAKPYHQAHARGVKLIGATAHFVNSELDEGPIIEQDVYRVSHSTSPEEMVAIGHEVEASVLSRAIKWHAERRVFLNGGKTVVLAKS